VAFAKGNNLGGRPRSELSFRAMLERACKQDDGKRVRMAAEKLLTLAADGEPWAIKELADRLDGKAGQSIALELKKRPAEELSDAELLHIAAGRSVRAAEKASGESESDRVH